MDYIYIIIIAIIVLIIFFIYKKYKNTNNTMINKKEIIKKENKLPIYAKDSHENLVHVGDIDDLNRKDDKSIIQKNNIQNGEVYFNTQESELQYMGNIEDLNGDLNIKPPKTDSYYLLTTHVDNKTNITYFIIYVTQNKI
jgi:hypothetical protein